MVRDDSRLDHKHHKPALIESRIYRTALDLLSSLDGKGLLRTLKIYSNAGGNISDQNSLISNFGSNDYLNLASRPELFEAGREAAQAYGAGSASSRLVTGTLPVHEALENDLARIFKAESALVCGAGYLANMAAIASLVGRDDIIVADKLIHASSIDGCRLSRAEFLRYKHNDLEDLERVLETAHSRRKAGRQILIVTESVFSMDGDLAPIDEIEDIAAKFDATLLVDEAHAVGVFGKSGRGRASENCIRVGTMSKAFGSYGGFILCSKPVRELIVNRGRSFIYNTALPPFSAGASCAALKILEKEPMLGAQLLKTAESLREELESLGISVESSKSQIIPIIVGENRKTIELQEMLRTNGIVAPAMRPPTVPEGSSRLRISLTLAHKKAELDKLLQCVSGTFDMRQKVG